MSFVQRERPSTDSGLRAAIYEGAVFLLPPTDESLALVDRATEVLRAHVGEDVRQAHQRFDDAELFERLGRVRRALYTDPGAHAVVRGLGASVGFGAAESAFDPARLRIVAPHAAENPRAASVYYPHRDTWYGHPRSLVVIWTALDDLRPDETFVFYPQRFRRSVPNDSEVFDYDAWVHRGTNLKIGWQDRDASLTARYPGATTREDYGPEEGFSCRRGEVLLFSGAHFHRTLPQKLATIRYSVDVRFVHLGDMRAGLGGPDVDNRSRGSALRDYVQPAADGHA